jgi:hypothetical protein
LPPRRKRMGGPRCGRESPHKGRNLRVTHFMGRHEAATGAAAMPGSQDEQRIAKVDGRS